MCFFSLMFTYFLPNQRKADSNNGNLFVSFPMTVIVFQEKRAKKDLVPWGSGTWGAPDISKASRRCSCTNLKSTLKASGTSPVFERTWVPYSKSAVFSDVCFGCSVDISKIKVTDEKGWFTWSKLQRGMGYGQSTMHLHPGKLTWMPKYRSLEDDFPFEVGDV